MTIQNNPELKQLTVELSHEEAAVVSDALHTAHEAVDKTGAILHPVFHAFHKELRLIAEKLGLIPSK
jgi:hypothetical protein